MFAGQLSRAIFYAATGLVAWKKCNFKFLARAYYVIFICSPYFIKGESITSGRLQINRLFCDVGVNCVSLASMLINFMVIA